MTLQTHVTGSSNENEISKVLSITENGSSSHSTTITTITGKENKRKKKKVGYF